MHIAIITLPGLAGRKRNCLPKGLKRQRLVLPELFSVPSLFCKGSVNGKVG